MHSQERVYIHSAFTINFQTKLTITAMKIIVDHHTRCKFWDIIIRLPNGGPHTWLETRTDDGHLHHLYISKHEDDGDEMKLKYEYAEDSSDNVEDAWVHSYGIIHVHTPSRVARLNIEFLIDLIDSQFFFSNLTSLFFDDIETQNDVTLFGLTFRALNPKSKSHLYLLHN